FGPEVHIPAGLDRDALELRRQGVERLLTDLTLEAEGWAASGLRRQGEAAIRLESRALQRRQLLLCDVDSSTCQATDSLAQADLPTVRLSA
ncbi:MAG: hypothetical protein MI725_14615, partial [Pirellulales bacterium]|nr:hypothetical protein [Pirellulales bacterium]